MKENQNIEIGNYVVAFIDILGQREALSKFTTLPAHDDPEEIHKVTALCKETFGVIEGLSGSVKSFFDGYLDKKYVFAQIIGHPEIKIQRFSDGLVFFISLRDNLQRVSVGSVFGLLAACCSVFLTQLAGKHPVRGGIEIGMGTELREGEIYGPVVANAYVLESNIAQYPRIVIGNELWNYLTKTTNLKGNSQIEQLNNKIANECLSLLTLDCDGRPILDYLGEGFLKKNNQKPIEQLISKAYEFVINQSELFQKEQKAKLAFRYTLLRNYFDYRYYKRLSKS